MDFEMGVDGFPAISMTQFAARQYTKWLSMKTGRFYRLPSEAEWEYACRAGHDDGLLVRRRSEAARAVRLVLRRLGATPTTRSARRRRIRWGLYDMHGNVAEWVLDAHATRLLRDPRRGAGDPSP
jgi:formylglycine-generating enzyme required for sulfatase activity